MSAKPDSTVKTIVLVHGGFVDGSGWEGVYQILKRDGYNGLRTVKFLLADSVEAHVGRFPHKFSDMANLTGELSPSNLVCPSDPNREPALLWEDLTRSIES